MSTVAGTARKGGRYRAGLLVDVALCVPLLVAACAVILPRLGIAGAGAPAGPSPLAGLVATIALWMLTLFSYSTFFEALFGRTPGGAMAGLRVVGRGGGRSGAWRTAVRNFLRYLFPFLRDHADRIAGTEVVASGRGASLSTAPPWVTSHDDVEAAKRRVGREAELAVANELYPLVGRGYFLFSNIEHRAFGDIDHLLVGPGGVFVVETKGHRGTVTADELSGELLRDGEPFEKDFRVQAERQAKHVAAAVFKGGRCAISSASPAARSGRTAEASSPPGSAPSATCAPPSNRTPPSSRRTGRGKPRGRSSASTDRTRTPRGPAEPTQGREKPHAAEAKQR